MKKELSKKAVKEKALRYLEFRTHSEKELRDKLKRAGACDEDILTVMEFLKEYGLLNDREYAKHLARDMQNLKKYGKLRIINELRHRGIANEYIDDAVSELEAEESDTLYPLIEKRLGGDFDRKNIEKVARYFAYRGYGYDDIKSCIDRLRQEYGED